MNYNVVTYEVHAVNIYNNNLVMNTLWFKPTRSKKIIILWLLCFLSILIPNTTFGENVMSVSEYTKNITDDIDNTRKWVKQEDRKLYTIFNRLCENVIKKWATTLQWHRYNPQESLFVTITCNSLQSDKLSKESINNELILNSIIKRKNLRDLWLICSKRQWSSLSQNISDTSCENFSLENDMDYPFLFQKTMNAIQNDWINLSLARIYWVTNSEISNSYLANKYITEHFQTIGKIPEAKNYPNTHKQLVQYIKNGKNIQKEAYIIDHSKIKILDINKAPSISLFLSENIDSNIDPITKSPLSHKINTDIVFNEIFFYTIFTSTYKEYLERVRTTDENLLPKSREEKNFTTKQAITLQQWRVDKNQSEIITTTQESIRQLWNLESSYPIHIGFLMYQEDLLNLRNNLAKIYLPLHQLHYKLENVQSKN